MTTDESQNIKDRVSYDPDTGTFVWRIGRYAGRVAGSLSVCGAIQFRHNGKAQYAHRLAWLYMTGEQPIADIDHINGVRSDNRWCNLRQATRAQNTWNRRQLSGTASGVKGVSWHKGTRRWYATIKRLGVIHEIGYFNDLATAAIAVRSARERLHGEFARHG
jgi:hypothetical protein